MAKHILLLPLLLISSNLGVIFSAPSSSICKQTPYPDQCNSLTPPDGSPSSLFGATLRETFVQAQNLSKFISNIDQSKLNNRAKTAWADCAFLYENSIFQLNRSIASQNKQLDVQTWLTAAIANEQTCLNGFIDLKLFPSLFSLPSSQRLTNSTFSKFLRNALAINMAISPSSVLTNNQGLLDQNYVPEWVSASDRKLLQSPVIKADIVVAQDGSGRYKTISAGLAAAASTRRGTKRFVIYVKKGIYRENVKVTEDMKNIMVIGDGIDGTIVTGVKNAMDGSTTTLNSATFGIFGDGFIGRDITFENTAGASKHQAVALQSSSDLSVFYQCSFKGYQDTLYAHSNRQFYRNCDIYGTVDFIFGFAAAVIQNCNIYLRQPLPDQINTITAQGRSSPNEQSGFTIQKSRIAAAPGTALTAESYLGRPWRKYSRTIFMQCAIDDVIQPAGWVPWKGTFALSTLYYGEYMNTGGGANTAGRVKWQGLHVGIPAAKAGEFTVGKFLAGDAWLSASGVPFISGL